VTKILELYILFTQESGSIEEIEVVIFKIFNCMQDNRMSGCCRKQDY